MTCVDPWKLLWNCYIVETCSNSPDVSGEFGEYGCSLVNEQFTVTWVVPPVTVALLKVEKDPQTKNIIILVVTGIVGKIGQGDNPRSQFLTSKMLIISRSSLEPPRLVAKGIGTPAISGIPASPTTTGATTTNFWRWLRLKPGSQADDDGGGEHLKVLLYHCKDCNVSKPIHPNNWKSWESYTPYSVFLLHAYK